MGKTKYFQDWTNMKKKWFFFKKPQQNFLIFFMKNYVIFLTIFHKFKNIDFTHTWETFQEKYFCWSKGCLFSWKNTFFSYFFNLESLEDKIIDGDEEIAEQSEDDIVLWTFSKLTMMKICYSFWTIISELSLFPAAVAT